MTEETEDYLKSERMKRAKSAPKILRKLFFMERIAELSFRGYLKFLALRFVSMVALFTAIGFLLGVF